MEVIEAVGVLAHQVAGVHPAALQLIGGLAGLFQ